jgi:hypothetical protein
MRALFYSPREARHANSTPFLVRGLVERGHDVTHTLTTESEFNPESAFHYRLLPTTVAVLPRLVEEARAKTPDVVVFDSCAPWGYAISEILGVPGICLVSSLFDRDEARELPDALNLEALDQIERRWGVDFRDHELGSFYGRENLVFSREALAPKRARGVFHFVGPATGGGLDAALAVIEARALSLTSDVLAGGGDERIAVNPQTGRNRYGCRMRRESEAVAEWSSCTASTPSSRAFDAAGELEERLSVREAMASGEQVRGTLLELVGLAPADEVDVALMPSGTDAEFIPLAFLLGEGGASVANVVVGEGELGASTVLAASARHCVSIAPSSGAPLEKGSPVRGFPPDFVTTHCVRVRDERGEARERDAVEREVATAVSAALGRGQRVLLHLVDSSKTGIQAPSLELVERLAADAPDRVRVVVDAAQGRLGDRQLRAYLARGFMVIFSGSKFYGGPSFCAAVLIPRRTWGVPRGPIPGGLQHYLSKCALPEHWPIRGTIESTTNAGLLLRWAAALAEMRAYREVVPSVRCSILKELGTAIVDVASRFRSIELAPLPPRERLPEDDGLSELQTIFTFKLRAETDDYLGLADARRLREVMARGDRRFLLGQAVELAPGGPAGLRVAISASQVIAASTGKLGDVDDELMGLFGKLDLLISRGARA